MAKQLNIRSKGQHQKGINMIYLLVISIFMLAVVMAWFIQKWLNLKLTNYKNQFEIQATKNLSDMFLFLDSNQVWMASISMAIFIGLLCFLLFSNGVVAILCALFLLFSPQFIIKRLKHKRLVQIDKQLPDFLLALAGALRAGSSLQTSLNSIVQYMPTPLKQELALLLRQQRMGLALEQALNEFYIRVPTEGVSLIVSALRISMQSGGSLADTLETIASTLRSRLHLLGRIKAMTSQGKMQAWVMASLPIGMAAILYWLDPDSMRLLWSTTTGWVIILLIIFLEFIGMFFIKKIVNIKV